MAVNYDVTVLLLGQLHMGFAMIDILLGILMSNVRHDAFCYYATLLSLLLDGFISMSNWVKASSNSMQQVFYLMFSRDSYHKLVILTVGIAKNTITNSAEMHWCSSIFHHNWNEIPSNIPTLLVFKYEKILSSII